MKKLNKQRQKLASDFCTRARLEGLKVLPHDDNGQFDLLERLYEEYKDDRGVIIDTSNSTGFYLDYFFKKTERHDSDLHLLYIVVLDPSEMLNELWGMYRDWLHKRRSPAELEATYRRLEKR